MVLGIDLGTSSVKILKKYRDGSVEKLKKLCVVLGVSSDEILFGNTQTESSAAFFEKISVLSESQVLILSDIINKYIEAVSLDK